MQQNPSMPPPPLPIRHFAVLVPSSQSLLRYPRPRPPVATPLLSASQPHGGILPRFPVSPLFYSGSGPSLARRKTLRGLLQIMIDNVEAKVSSSSGSNYLMTAGKTSDRRKLLLASLIGFSIDAFQNAIDAFQNAPVNCTAIAAEFADMPALRGKDYGKTKMRYPDYTETQSGLQFKDLRMGDGLKPMKGETVVVDWDGYTIGYYGRIFEARNKTKGGSFEGEDKDFFKFKLGSQQVIPAFEEAITGMSLGGIRRIIVPPELGYPDYDFNKLGPRPTTFSGQRALDFVLRNQGLIDKTLLFDIELIKIISN